MFARAIAFFGYPVFDPTDFEESPDGFQEYLDATGVKFFSAREMTSPNHGDVARRHGYQRFLPEQAWWQRGGALAALADTLRGEVGEPVRMRNWWRPRGYNEDVGGAAGSDHVTAHGVDLDYRSVASRRTAEAKLRGFQRAAPWLELSLGLGARTTHVGIGSPRGGREWHYESYTR